MTSAARLWTIVQLTDCHLFADPEGATNGVVTRPRLETVLDDLRSRVPDLDLVVVTGDTASDEQPATYEAFREALGELAGKLRILPGNHDSRSLLRRTFPDAGFEADGRLGFHDVDGRWQLLGLDTQLHGEVSGELGEEQLERARDLLAAEPGLDTALFLHHPPIEVGSAWLDAIGLRDAASFARLLSDSPQVRVVFTGHVHQEVEGTIAGATVLTTPAVGPQFRPRTTDFQIEPGPPGYRIVELAGDGTWSTTVVRCGKG